MATITFHCPKCESMCAFSDRFIGRRCRCLKCGQFLIIPSSENEKPQIIKISYAKGEPLPGFYEAVFKKSLKAIFHPNSIPMLMFILISTTCWYFLAPFNFWFTICWNSCISIYLPIGYFFTFICWGLILTCFYEIVYMTSIDQEYLPGLKDIFLPEGNLVETAVRFYGIIALIAKSAYKAAMCVFVTAIPLIISLVIMNFTGRRLALINWLLLAICFFFFPAVYLNFTLEQTLLSIARLDRTWRIITSTKQHYIFSAFSLIIPLLIILAIFLYRTRPEPCQIQGGLRPFLYIATIVSQFFIVLSMRILGLFDRHFRNCYLGN